MDKKKRFNINPNTIVKKTILKNIFMITQDKDKVVLNRLELITIIKKLRYTKFIKNQFNKKR